MDEMKELPDLKGYTSEQLGQLAQVCYQEQTKRRQEEVKKIKDNLKETLSSKEAKSLRKDFAELKKAHAALSQKSQVTYNVPLTLNFDVSDDDDLTNQLAFLSKNWHDYFSYTVTGKIGKIQGASPIVAKVLNEQLDGVLEDACEEVMMLNPELHKTLNAFVKKASEFRNKYCEFVRTNLNNDWLLLDGDE